MPDIQAVWGKADNDNGGKEMERGSDNPDKDVEGDSLDKEVVVGNRIREFDQSIFWGEDKEEEEYKDKLFQIHL
jgi:hypothetical protein